MSRSPLYVLEAYGLGAPWVAWRIRRGGLDELCAQCGGAGVVVTSPCEMREPGRPLSCDLEAGCVQCRRACGGCRGRGVPVAPVHEEDFGDAASREVARRVCAGLSVSPLRRIDMESPALGPPRAAPRPSARAR